MTIGHILIDELMKLNYKKTKSVYFSLFVFFTFIFIVCLPLYVPQNAQATCGITAFPHCGHFFKIFASKAWWERLRPLQLELLRFPGTDIF
jgi:hypothetical protein